LFYRCIEINIIFTPVKRNRIILSIASALLGIILMIGSTGITMIIHQCDSCNDFSVHAGIYLSPSIPDDDCCESADNHSSSHSTASMEIACCHFIVEKLKVTNYTSSEPVAVSAPALLAPIYNIPDVYTIINHPISSVDIKNKHGARYTITYYSQFLA